MCCVALPCAVLCCILHGSHHCFECEADFTSMHSHAPGELLDANANLVLQLARPFAADPTIDSLISIRPGQAVG